jgi:hypothetical protein
MEPARVQQPRLPTFLIIGAMKSGTTTLGAYLNHHPDAFCAQEPHFFDQNFERGVEWYRERFRDAGTAAVVGEKSPSYMYHPDAIRRISEVLPDARLIAILRHPVHRAYSHYWHQRRLKQETLSFDDALDAEPGRLREDAAGMSPFGYVDRGLYLEQLERVVRFAPRERLLVLLFEDLLRAPLETYSELGRFLGIDGTLAAPPGREDSNTYRSYHPEWAWRLMNRHRLWRRLPLPIAGRLWRAMQREATYPPIGEALQAHLIDLFAEPNRALAHWLGRDLSEWSV